MELKLKVCGLRNSSNVELAKAIDPDFMGFIFYPGSPRYTGADATWIHNLEIPEKTAKVGVFVNTDVQQILDICKTAEIKYVQLHGAEPVEICKKLRENGLNVIKMFSVGPGFNFGTMEPFHNYVDYFLFDTKGEFLGGNGIPFDWNLIENYPFEVPFFLSGGIGSDNITNVKYLDQKYLFGIDVNSRLETKPGEKDIFKLKEFRKKFEELR